MTQDVLMDLYEVVKQRKEHFEEGSYTCYLFQQGLDKILKKCGEECSEMIIASKNESQEDLVGEIGDLIYHMMVLMVERGVPLEDVMALLEKRSQKIGNLKKFHVVDRES
ncbi:MAG: phosphoribosyl-ATP diphosphatase [Massiliimalia sp.]|jgi:phosphoribosyl-ATP pyrophosphohydrolase